MNDAHFHLVLNHLPIIVPLVGLLVMIGGYVLRSEIIKRTAFLIFAFGALATIPVFLTGEGAEEVIEQIQGIDEKFIEPHEEIAETFAILSYILGAISLLGLWASYKQKSLAGLVSVLTTLFAIVVLFFAQQTGTTGGEIRHTEIRNNNVLNASDSETMEKEQSDD